MKFRELSVAGAFAIDLERHKDERGFFARSFCTSELRAHGMALDVAQCNISFNLHRGTLRGMHFTRPAIGETKMVRAVRGGIYDVVLDLRQGSPTYLRWEGVELTADNGCAVYVPDGCAHGFLTLTEASEVHYLMGTAFVPTAAAGVRFDDEAFAIRWPIPVTVISDRDRTYPDYSEKAE